MGITKVLCAFIAGMILCGCGANTKTAPRPNIILILADDLGYGDLSCFGCPDIQTPHIDSIAKTGVKFTQAYAYPTCSPTRAALLTGNYAERAGISKALMGDDAPKIAGMTTVAELLQGAGYVTGLVGKWHLGYADDVSPTRKGFDEFFGFRGGKIDFYKHTDTAQKVKGSPDGKHDLWEGERPIEREGYTTDLFTARARQFIRDHAGGSAKKPFFLFLAHNAPHYAKPGLWQAPEKYLKRFNAEGQVKGRDVYRAMVACLDDSVGEILAELSSQKIDRNTLVIFMSDNGPDKPGSSGPLRGAKFTYYEGGVRVPWVARWPGVIPAGKVRDDVVHATDFLPSMLAAAHLEQPPGLKLDGVNVWPAFVDGKTVADRPVYFSDVGLRLGDWKLINGELYNLRTDTAEMTNVASRHPGRVGKLANQSEAWASEVGIERPGTKPRSSK